MQCRSLVLAAAAFVGCASRAEQHAGPHHTLPVAPSSPRPLRQTAGRVPHHMTPEQESQRVKDSPALAALPIPRGEMQ